MSDLLQVFENPELGSVRSLIINGEPYFVGKDVATALGYGNPRDALSRHIDPEDKGVVKHDTPGGVQELTVINESGVYALTFSSKLKQAKQFKRWVTSEVLPAIRKHGLYAKDEIIEKIIDDPDFGIRLFTELKEERKKNQLLSEELAAKTDIIETMQPKVSYYDLVLQCTDLLTTTEIAKDYGMSAKEFNKLLHDMDIQFKQSGRWFLYAKYDGYGYASSKTAKFTRKDGSVGTSTNMQWTQKGRLFLYNTLKENGVLPLIEMDDVA